jgi:hypothetical protein
VKHKAWGFTVQVDGKQKRVYKAEWTKDGAQKALAALLLKVEQPKPTSGMTLAEATERYLATKTRKRTLKKDERTLQHLESAFGVDTPIDDLTASRISEYKAKRLATKVGKPGAERLLTAAAVNRPLALLRHLLRVAHEEWEALRAVPKIRLEKEPQGRLRWLTRTRSRSFWRLARSRETATYEPQPSSRSTPACGGASCSDSLGTAWI